MVFAAANEFTIRPCCYALRLQVLHVNVHDVDTFNPASGLLSGGLNIFKGTSEMFNARELIGRCAIPLKPVCAAPRQVGGSEAGVYMLPKDSCKLINMSLSIMLRLSL